MHNKKIYRHIIFWVVFYGVTYFTVLRFDKHLYSMKFSLSLITPIFISVYIHSFIFEKLFNKKKYYSYAIFLLLIIIGFGYLIESIFSNFLYAEIEGYLTISVFLAAFTGFKYLEIGTKQQLKIEREEAKRLLAETKQVRAELDLLKSQINPHFLFNTLNGIYSLIIEKNDLAGIAVLKLSSLLRYLLDSTNLKNVTLNQECEFIRNYIDLEKIRLDDRCKIQFKVKGDLVGKKIPPLLLTPFIENAFKHGIGAQSELNFIIICLDVSDKKAKLKVKNRVAHKKNEKHTKKGRTGLENVKKRLKLTHPDNHKLLIVQKDDIFNVELELEL